MPQISDEGRWIQRRVYSTLFSNYVIIKGMTAEAAAELAASQSAHAAIDFSRRFPSVAIVEDLSVADPVIDVTQRVHPGSFGEPQAARVETIVPPPVGQKMHAGVETFVPSPKKEG